MRRRQSSFETFVEKYELRTSPRYRLGIYALLGLVLYFVLIGTVLPVRYDLVVGQVSQVLITAPIAAVNTTASAKARVLAAQSVAPRYDINPAVERTALRQLDQVFNQAAILRAKPAKDKSKNLKLLRAASPPSLSNAALESLLTMTNGQFALVNNNAIQIAQGILQGPYSTADQTRATMMVDQQLVSLDVDKTTRLSIGQLVLSVLHPNLVYDGQLTQEARLAAERSVPDVWINRGDIIVRRGQLVTPSIMNQLKDLKLLKSQPDYSIYVGFLLFVMVLVLATGVFIQTRRIRLAKDNVRLLLYAGLIVLVAVLIRITRAAVDMGLPAAVSYAIPVAMGSMMISLFFGTSLAMLTSVLLAVLTSAAFGFDFTHFFVELAGALGATMAMKRVHHRRVFMRAGSLAAIFNIISIAIMHLVLGPGTLILSTVVMEFIYGIIGGLLSAILTIGLLPYLETTFGVITHMGLLELANPNHPLLRKLLLEAPGTYHHSLIVGNLAEAAAETIGADPLICRVGALYHDVGKIKRPMFFIENQMVGDNPHDKVAPALSHLILTSHVTDGLEMLREYNLPEPIRDICAQHHGTTVLWYFYNKAIKEDEHHVPEVDQYRYPGPKPHSKESAIVMMCDAVEASVRSMGKPTPPRIETMIRKIIKDRLQDGQLDQCDITLQDLNKMVDAFMRTLQGIYHERIEYPDPAKITAGKAK